MLKYYLKKLIKYLFVFIFLGVIGYCFYKMDFFKQDIEFYKKVIPNFQFKDLIFSSLFMFIYLGSLSIIIYYLLFKRIFFTYQNGKKITKKNTPYYREIPCDGDIYLADIILKMNRFGKSYNNIFSAVLLKWILKGKLTIKDDYFIINKTLQDDNVFEGNFFAILSNRAKGDKLYYKDFKESILDFKQVYNVFFESAIQYQFRKLLNADHVILKKKTFLRRYYLLDDYIYSEAKKLYGLKLFLHDFNNLDSKDIQDVYMWEKYLMFACILGETNSILKQLRLFFKDSSTEFISKYKELKIISGSLEPIIKSSNTKNKKINIKNIQKE